MPSNSEYLTLGLFFQILSVEQFVKSVNGALRNRQDAEKLKGIADRIEAYDAVVREYLCFANFTE